jgi:hypothetical protein
MWKPALVLTVLLPACVTAPTVHEFQKTWTMPGSFDQTWTATVQLFAENGWPIATLARDSGIIVSDWVDIGTEGNFTDCGSAPLAVALQREAKFNVFIRDAATGPTLTVNANFRELRSFNQQTVYADCTSMGVLEAQLHDQILERAR